MKKTIKPSGKLFLLLTLVLSTFISLLSLSKPSANGVNIVLLNDVQAGQYSGNSADGRYFSFRLNSNQAVLFSLQQLNVDLQLEIEDINNQAISQFSIPAKYWSEEQVIVTWHDCHECVLRIQTVGKNRQVGDYSLTYERISISEHQAEVDYLSKMTEVAKEWGYRTKNELDLGSVKDLLNKVVVPEKIKDSDLKNQRVLFLKALATHLQGDFQRQKEICLAILEQYPQHSADLIAIHLMLNQQYYLLGLYDKAKAHGDLAHSMAEKMNQPLLLNLAKMYEGMLFEKLGNQTQAEKIFETVYRQFAILGDWKMTASILINQGWLKYRHGDLESALYYYHQASNISTTYDLPLLLADVQIKIGRVLAKLGKIEQAIEKFETSLLLTETQKSEVVRGRAWQAKGEALLDVGLFSLAKNAFNHSLEAYVKADAIDDSMNVRYLLAKTYQALGNYLLSDELIQQVILFDENKEFPNYRDLGSSYHLLAGFSLKQAKYSKAAEYQKLAFDNFERVDDYNFRGRSYSQAGLIAHYNSESTKSEQYFATAARLTNTDEDRFGSISNSYQRALVYSENKEFLKALELLSVTQTQVEDARSSFSRVDLRQSFLAVQQGLSDLHIQILRQTSNNPLEMLQVAEVYRSRTLYEQVSRMHDLQAENSMQKSQRQLLQGELQTLASQYHFLNDRIAREQFVVKSELLATKLKQLDSVSRVNAALPKLVSIDTVTNKVKNIQASIPLGTAILYFDLNDRQSNLWAITRSGLKYHQLSPKKIIDDNIQLLLPLLSSKPTGQGSSEKNKQQQLIETLSQILLPDNLLDWSSIHKIAVVPDGALNFLPFSILQLPTENSPLVMSKEVTYASSLMTFVQSDSMDRELTVSTQTNILVVANPAMRSSSSSVLGSLHAEFELTELPYTTKEAESIFRVNGEHTKILSRESANKKDLLASSLSSIQILHFATHGLASNESSVLSGIVLSNTQSNDHLLLASEISEIPLKAELVVLSGCKTGIGKQLNGEGLMGLNRAFFEAGSKRVIASLWSVQDEATAELMKHFYKMLLEDKLPVAESLRLAQQHVRNYRRSNNQKPWKAPFYWAGFVLQGPGDSWIEQ